MKVFGDLDLDWADNQVSENVEKKSVTKGMKQNGTYPCQEACPV